MYVPDFESPSNAFDDGRAAPIAPWDAGVLPRKWAERTTTPMRRALGEWGDAGSAIVPLVAFGELRS